MLSLSHCEWFELARHTVLHIHPSLPPIQQRNELVYKVSHIRNIHNCFSVPARNGESDKRSIQNRFVKAVCQSLNQITLIPLEYILAIQRMRKFSTMWALFQWFCFETSVQILHWGVPGSNLWINSEIRNHSNFALWKRTTFQSV